MEGKLVRLRAYDKSDLDALMKWVNDEEVTRFLGHLLTYPASRQQEEKFLESAAGGSPDHRTFAIETLAGEYLGGISLHNINWIDRQAQIGIVIGDKSCWARGYGTDAMQVLLRLAFDKMNLHRVWLRVFTFNQRAIACYLKCGFKQEGLLRVDRFSGGRYHDTIVMAMLRSEYVAGADAAGR